MIANIIDKDNLNNFQSQLNKNADFLELLLNTIPDPVFYKNKDGIYEHCNSAFSEIILGIPREIIIGKSLFDIPDYIPHNLALIYKEKDQHLFDNPGTQVYESDVKCSNGEIRRFKFHKATLQDKNENVIGIVGVMLDVTEIYNSHKELELKNIQLQEMSFKDSLTNIYNRRMFDDIFVKLLKNAKRNKNVFNLVILDVDNFKLYNDTFGHLKGDKALISISKILNKSMKREEDYCFRLGGEEFGLIFSTNSTDSAYEIVNTIKKDIENLQINHISQYGKVTASFGLISVKDNQIHNQDYIYKEADNLLYKAKENGRNRIFHKTI